MQLIYMDRITKAVLQIYHKHNTNVGWDTTGIYAKHVRAGLRDGVNFD